MGFCYTSGKLKNGHIIFDRCNGNSSQCNDGSSGTPYNGMVRNKDCIEFCKTRKESLVALKHWLLEHPDEGDDETLVLWAKHGIGDFKGVE